MYVEISWMQCGIYAYVYSKRENSISQKQCINETPIAGYACL